MEWRSFFFLLTCLLMQNLVSGKNAEQESITVKKTQNGFEFTCKDGNWNEKNSQVLSLDYEDRSQDYVCEENKDNKRKTLTVKFRTCEYCIELDTTALSAIIVGNILATIFVGFAVYSITGESKGKSFSGNKASDKVTLLTNGETDTYQQLNPGQSSEYSRLGVGRRK